MAWVNLLEAVYPIGSVYISVSSTSPAAIVGGTWTQVKGACLGACEANGFATSGTYGGKLAMTIAQMPRHHHYIDIYSSSWSTTADTLPLTTNAVAWGQWTNKQVRSADSRNDDAYTGESANFVPYHFGVYIWHRTA